MPWVRVEDGFHDDPRVMTAGLAATGLLVLSLSYSNRNLTNGWIPAAVLRRFAASDGNSDQVIAAAVAAQLVQAEEHDGLAGFRIHDDYVKLQPSREQVELARAGAKARKEAWRERRSRARNGKGTRRSQRDSTVPNTPVTLLEHVGHIPPDPGPDPSSRDPKSVGTDAHAPDRVQALIDLWNSERKPGPLVKHLTDQRRRQIELRLREHPNLADWRSAVQFINRQRWCNAPGTGDYPDYRMDFDTLLRPGKLAGMLEKLTLDRSNASTDGSVGRDASRGRTGAKRGEFAAALAGNDGEGDDR